MPDLRRVHPPTQTADQGWLRRLTGPRSSGRRAGSPTDGPRSTFTRARQGLGTGGYRQRFDSARHLVVGLDQAEGHGGSEEMELTRMAIDGFAGV